MVAIKLVAIFDLQTLKKIQKELTEAIGGVSQWMAGLYDCFSYLGNLYVVTEYFENGSLLDIVLPF